MKPIRVLIVAVVALMLLGAFGTTGYFVFQYGRQHVNAYLETRNVAPKALPLVSVAPDFDISITPTLVSEVNANEISLPSFQEVNMPEPIIMVSEDSYHGISAKEKPVTEVHKEEQQVAEVVTPLTLPPMEEVSVTERNVFTIANLADSEPKKVKPTETMIDASTPVETMVEVTKSPVEPIKVVGSKPVEEVMVAVKKLLSMVTPPSETLYVKTETFTNALKTIEALEAGNCQIEIQNAN